VPELPEVETVRRGIEPLLVGQTVARLICRVPKLRWEIDPELNRKIANQKINAVNRRAKYLLIHLDHSVLVVHLGMTGILRVLDASVEPLKHDHFDLIFHNGTCLRLNDSRRFGAIFLVDGKPEESPPFRYLGPEPLSANFNVEYLFARSRKCSGSVKSFLMNQKIVVGVGNIYACEALFAAGIDPRRAAHRISASRYEGLVRQVKAVLTEAIRQGGTTIRDFAGSDGKPGYFKQQLKVYGREGEPCVVCHEPIRNVRLAGRSTFFCPKCQR